MFTANASSLSLSSAWTIVCSLTCAHYPWSYQAIFLNFILSPGTLIGTALDARKAPLTLVPRYNFYRRLQNDMFSRWWADADDVV